MKSKQASAGSWEIGRVEVLDISARFFDLVDDNLVLIKAGRGVQLNAPTGWLGELLLAGRIVCARRARLQNC